MPYNERLEIRLTPEQRKLIEEAAWAKRQKLAAWVRETLVIVAGRQTGKTDA